MNPLSIVGGMAGIGLGSAITNGISSLFGNHQQRQNLKMMREQMAFHKAEREASQNYQTSERLAQQAYQTSERDAQNIWQESMYGKYQSPEAMVRQYDAAGINGKLAASGQAGMGSMSVSGGSNGGAPSSGAPSGHSVSAPYQNINAQSAGFADIASSLKALGEAKKLGIETAHYEEMINQQIRGAQLENDFKSLNLDIAKIYAQPMARAAYEKLAAEISKTNMDVQVAEKQVDILVQQHRMAKDEADQFKEQLRLNRLKTSSEINAIDVKADLDKETKNLVHEQAKTQVTTRGLQISQAALNNAMTPYYNSLKNLTDSQKLSEDERRQILQHEKLIKDYERRWTGATLSERIQTTQQMAEEMQKQIELLEAKIREAQSRGDLNEVRMYTEILGAATSFKAFIPTPAPTHYHSHTGSTTNNIYN